MKIESRLYSGYANIHYASIYNRVFKENNLSIVANSIYLINDYDDGTKIFSLCSEKGLYLIRRSSNENNP
jgi:hypothetical protein